MAGLLPESDSCQLPAGLGRRAGAGQEASSGSRRRPDCLPRNRYKQKKEIENKLAALKTFVDSGRAEEEQTREFYVLQIKRWISTSLEEVESIDQEMAILSRRNALRKVGGPLGRVEAPALAERLVGGWVGALLLGSAGWGWARASPGQKGALATSGDVPAGSRCTWAVKTVVVSA